MIRSKKGLSYIDWVISLGTFLIAIIMIFILIRPHVIKAEQKENLINLIETPFYAKTEWATVDVPVIIHSLSELADEGEPRKVRARITFEDSAEYHLEIPPSSPLEVFDGNPLIIECSSGICHDEMITLKFYPSSGAGTIHPLASLSCDPDDKLACDVALGAGIETAGLNQEKIASLANQEYEALKNEWRYPEKNDFAIFIDDIRIAGVDPPQQGNIYVKERAYWYLEQDGNRIPITLRIHAW